MKTKTRGVREAAAALQSPGSSVTFSGGGRSATIADPREECLTIAQTYETEWFELDRLLANSWPSDEEGEPIEFQNAAAAKRIGDVLIRRIMRLQFLAEFEIGYLYRHKENWESKGRIVYGKLSKPPAREAFYSDHHFEIALNWLLWRASTPWQKVALVYHELRHADLNEKSKPATQGHHIECFFDELELFGTNTYKEWAELARAAFKGDGVDVQYHIFDNEKPNRG